MPRRERIRSLSDEQLDQVLTDAVCDWLTSPTPFDAEVNRRLERTHREWARRHRGSAATGCTCSVCFDRGLAFNPLEEAPSGPLT